MATESLKSAVAEAVKQCGGETQAAAFITSALGNRAYRKRYNMQKQAREEFIKADPRYQELVAKAKAAVDAKLKA